MKIYLWWWRNSRDPLKKIHSLLSTIFERENVQQILHIPFARTGIRKKRQDSFSPSNFSVFVEKLWIEYLCWLYYEDIEKFTWDTIYINGWNDGNNLMTQCSMPPLEKAISKSRLIVWESYWAMIFWEYFRDSDLAWRKKGFWVVENTIIEPHYLEKNWKEILEAWLTEHPWTVWVWIDEMTFVVYENNSYGEKFWPWWVHHMTL